MPKDRPILFNADMVRALLDGRKTQTRRVMKPQPEPTPDDYPGPKGHWWPCNTVQSMVHIEDEVQNGKEWSGFAAAICPYGQAGDRLWVRETFAYAGEEGTTDGAPNDDWRPANPSFLPEIHRCWYRATDGHSADGFWKPSIHMPRWASRITLEIVSVRVERLKQISERDALQEGIGLVLADDWPDPKAMSEAVAKSRRAGFKLLWESINGAESWTANPWVWVVEFKRVEDSQ